MTFRSSQITRSSQDALLGSNTTQQLSEVLSPCPGKAKARLSSKPKPKPSLGVLVGQSVSWLYTSLHGQELFSPPDTKLHFPVSITFWTHLVFYLLKCQQSHLIVELPPFAHRTFLDPGGRHDWFKRKHKWKSHDKKEHWRVSSSVKAEKHTESHSTPQHWCCWTP